jgi:aminoglycoside phosphotransferase (APT) family kinase protein
MHRGSFNFSIRLHWEDGKEDWLIRFPIPGKSMFLDQKVYREAVLMKHIAEETNIPVPKIICYGRASENPTGLGPFIIMTWVEGKKLSDVLKEEDNKVDMLNPNLAPDVLKRAYDQMARVLSSLWSLDFDKIGSLGEESTSGKIVIDGPPLTQEVNKLIRASGIQDPSP